MTITAVGIPVFLVLVVLVVVFLLIYKKNYQKRINQSLNQDQEFVQRKETMPPGSVAAKTVAIICVCFIIVLFMLFNGLSQKLESFEDTNRRTLQIAQELQERLDELEKMNKKIVDLSYSFSDFDFEKNTAKINLKLFANDIGKNTNVSIQLNEQSVQLKNSGGAFVGSTTVGLFEELPYDVIVRFEDDSSINSETFEADIGTPFSEILPQAEVDFNVDGIKAGKSGLKFSFGVEFFTEMVDVDSLMLEVAVNGSKVDQKDYTNQLQKISEHEKVLKNLTYQNKNIKISNNDFYEVTLIFTDKAGYTHRRILISAKNTNYVNFESVYDLDENVYDKQGNQLY